MLMSSTERIDLTRAIMLQGTGSSVGKSLIVTGLARAFANRGLKVRPFKPQNMSNNAAVTADGGEIGRAQALQAVAARVPPSVHMNPVLLKPESPSGAQLIVRGQRRATLQARDFMRQRQDYLPEIMDSFRELCREADLIIAEGAGSPAEINLRDGDIANMGFAEAADIDVILVGDVHRGGVIASIVGTYRILPRADAARLKATIINNFHGDMALFADGRKTVERLIAEARGRFDRHVDTGPRGAAGPQRRRYVQRIVVARVAVDHEHRNVERDTCDAEPNIVPGEAIGSGQKRAGQRGPHRIVAGRGKPNLHAGRRGFARLDLVKLDDR